MGNQKPPDVMGRYRAIMTETDREYIAEEGFVEENKRHQSISRVRKRINEELPKDITVLKEHHPDLLDELRAVVCEPGLARAFEIARGVLDVRDRTRGGGEVLAEDVLDEIVEEHPPEFDEDEVETVMHAMADAGLLHERDGVMQTIFENPEVEPGECEWCGAPFPEAGRRDVTVYDPDGEQLETEHICADCLSERY